MKSFVVGTNKNTGECGFVYIYIYNFYIQPHDLFEKIHCQGTMISNSGHLNAPYMCICNLNYPQMNSSVFSPPPHIKQ